MTKLSVFESDGATAEGGGNPFSSARSGWLPAALTKRNPRSTESDFDRLTTTGCVRRQLEVKHKTIAASNQSPNPSNEPNNRPSSQKNQAGGASGISPTGIPIPRLTMTAR